jgi:hypothetical protein
MEKKRRGTGGWGYQGENNAADTVPAALRCAGRPLECHAGVKLCFPSVR